MSHLVLPPPPPKTLYIGVDIAAISGSTNQALSANVPFLYLFEIQSGVTVTAANWRCGTTATGHTNMAIYNAVTQTIIVGSDTGAQVNSVSTNKTFSYASSFWLPQGAYFIALACDNGTDTYIVISSPTGGGPLVRGRQAVNSLSGGALPSALGGLGFTSKEVACSFTVSGGI